MRIKKILTLIFVAITAAAQAQTMPPMPTDSATRIGKLDNGLTYYIRHNAYPEKVANFYIAQRVGSIQEEDSQRGLAHFLEHMAFNGSKHFKGNGMIEYLRSLGVAFGADLNAYTSIEQTVYNIDNVPTKRQSALDSCLIVLQDWSNGLLLETEEIDKERGVIHGEWAMHSSAMQRLFERNLPAMYPGSRYGERLPIGTMEVVDNFKPEELRDYYQKWYHPENQAIIVIGDIDVDHTEKMIKELFGDIKAGPLAAHVQPTPVPDNKEAIYIFDKDKEMQYSVMNISMKTEAMPREYKGTQMLYVQSYLANIISAMFNARMSEMALNPECPYVQLGMNYGTYNVSKPVEATSVTAVAKDGKEKETYATIIRELKRVKEYGFTGSEFARAKEEFLSQREKEYTNRDKRKHTEYYQECVSHFLDGNAMPDAETEYQLWQAVAQQLNFDIVNASAQKLITIECDSNLVSYCFAQEKDGAVYLTADIMKQIMNDVRKEKLEAWVDNAKDEPLIATMPKAGKIKKETKNDTFGYTELLLSNGAKVILKKTDFKDDEILLSATAKGGEAQYGEADYSNLRIFNDAMQTCGLGNFNNTELEKALAGKQASIGIAIGLNNRNVSGKSTPKDIETMMQLLYLNFTAKNKDEKAFATLVSMYETALKNRGLQPETQLSDSIAANLYCNDPRFKGITPDDLKNISIDRMLEIARENFSNANNFTFTFVGNFDETQMRQLACQYIASIPGKGKDVKPTEVRKLFSGKKVNRFTRKMETPKPYIVQFFNAPCDYNLRNDVLADYASNILSMELLKAVREDAGATYNIGANVQLIYSTEQPKVLTSIKTPISEPAKVDTAITIIADCMEKATKTIDPEKVAKVKANFMKNADVNLKRNSYWVGTINAFVSKGIDVMTDYKKTVESVTPEDIATFIKNNIMAPGNFLNIVMMPE